MISHEILQSKDALTKISVITVIREKNESNALRCRTAGKGTGLLTNLLRHCTPKNETTHEKQHHGDSFRFFKTRKSFPHPIQL